MRFLSWLKHLNVPTINLMLWKWASASFERLGNTLEKTNCFFSPLSVFLSPSRCVCVCVKAQDIFFEIPRPCCITTGHLYSLEPKVKSVTVKSVRREKEKRTIWHWEYFDSLEFDRHCGNNIASHGSPLGVVWWLSDLESYCMPAGAYAPGRNTHAGQVIGLEVRPMWITSHRGWMGWRRVNTTTCKETKLRVHRWQLTKTFHCAGKRLSMACAPHGAMSLSSSSSTFDSCKIRK